MKILLAGCGDIGQRTGARLTPSHQCFGLRRHPQNLPDTITPIVGNMADAKGLEKVLGVGFDVVVVTLTPDQFTEQAYRQSYLAGATALATAINRTELKPKLVIWVSSTSVYGNNKGDWVDEASPTQPTSFSGKLLLEAEQQIQCLPCAHSIVRFSGIYGPGRTRMLNQIKAGVGRPAEPQQWSNRIHSEDCAGVLAHLIRRFGDNRLIEPLYLATDCAPVTQHRMRNWLAAQMQIQLTDEIVEQKSIRRCSNQRLLDSGYEFIFPSYKEGYTALMADQ
ncbi:MAG: sugar nucleotide-binding protein [Porticoccaceae bacterium]|nr:sugar nucleotide-binding protein [Porticoccaceae bacterium]